MRRSVFLWADFINQPTMGGRIPIITSITIGCGTWGGNSVSENLTFRHLLNKTRVTRKSLAPSLVLHRLG